MPSDNRTCASHHVVSGVWCGQGHPAEIFLVIAMTSVLAGSTSALVSGSAGGPDLASRRLSAPVARRSRAVAAAARTPASGDNRHEAVPSPASCCPPIVELPGRTWSCRPVVRMRHSNHGSPIAPPCYFPGTSHRPADVAADGLACWAWPWESRGHRARRALRRRPDGPRRAVVPPRLRH
jgi:hypothetical protein